MTDQSRSRTVREVPGSPALYAQIGTQYYVAGRAAAARGHDRIVGNLFHLGFEMLLKSVLYSRNAFQPTELEKRFGHKLGKLWREAKARNILFFDPSPFDSFIAELDPWEDIRYGGFPEHKLARLSVEFFRATSQFICDPAFDDYVLFVEDADALFEVLIRELPGNSAYIRQTLIGPGALADYELNNVHVIT